MNSRFRHRLMSGSLMASLVLFSSLSFADVPPSPSPFAASELQALQQIATSVGQVSLQLTQMAQNSQQNWANYFTLEAGSKFSPEGYPEWQKMQGDLSTIQSNFNAGASNQLISGALEHIYNPELSTYLSEVDQVSLKTAGSAINQINQGSQGAQAMTDAVALPLSSAWEQDLSTANDIQVLKAISVQMSTNNALLYNLWQQSQTQQVLYPILYLTNLVMAQT